MIPLTGDKDIFVLFTFDSLMELSFYTQKSKAAREMRTMPTRDNCIFLKDYKELLGRRYLDDDEKCVIMNPLFYQPITPDVLVVRKGCIVLTDPLKDEQRGKTLLQVQFTEQRDFRQHRRTLRQNAAALRKDQESVLNLYGGTHVIRLRSVLHEIFEPVKPTQSKRFRSLFTKNDAVALVEQKLKNKIKDSFAVGILNGSTLLFANQGIIGSLPDENRHFCYDLFGE